MLPMNDYAARQSSMDMQYAECYNSPEVIAWIESLLPEQREQMEKDGLLQPMIDKAGSTMRDEDASESTMCSFEEIKQDLQSAQPTAGDVLASFCARIRGRSNPALVFDAICFATGVIDLEGVSATELAQRHGITKQAFSKIAVEWCSTFNIPPSRSMKSKSARRIYSDRASRIHAKNGTL